MFKHGLYQFIPSIQNSIVVGLWLMGMLVVLIGLLYS